MQFDLFNNTGILPISFKQCTELFFSQKYSHNRNTLCMMRHIDESLLRGWSEAFNIHLLIIRGETEKTISNYVSHFLQWFKFIDPLTQTPKQYVESITGRTSVGSFSPSKDSSDYSFNPNDYAKK